MLINSPVIETIDPNAGILPNGNPYPSPNFEYKLNWFKRLSAHAKKLLAYDVPVALIGDFNVMPTELDVYINRSVG